MRSAIAAAMIAAVATLSACGGSDDNTVSPADQISVTPTPSATPPPAAPARCATIEPNPPAKGEPTVPDVRGKAPTKLVVKDLKAGKGAPAKAGDELTVNYVGVSCSTGQAFDASYLRHQPFTFTIGQGMVIQGWDKGLIGMKPGGRRELVIPAAFGYGASGQGATIKPNETLIFVVDLEKIG